jgi:hypothetical protein
MHKLNYYFLAIIGWIAFMVALGFFMRIAFFFANIGWSLFD